MIQKRKMLWVNVVFRQTFMVMTAFVGGCLDTYKQTHVYQDEIHHLHIIAPWLTDVNVKGSDRDDLQVDVTGYFRFKESFKYEKKSTDGTVTVSVNCADECNRFFAYLSVEAPSTVSVTIESAANVRVEDVRADVGISTVQEGNVRLSNIEGSILVAAEYADVKVADIDGTVDVTSRFGSVTLRRVQGTTMGAASEKSVPEAGTTATAVNSVAVFVSQGDIDAASIEGNALLETDVGDITVDGLAGRLIAKSRQGHIVVDGSIGDLHLTVSEQGNIIGDDVSCDACTAVTASGYVDVSAMPEE